MLSKQLALRLALAGLLMALSACVSVPQRAAGTVFQDCPECPQMVVVPPGQFDMGEAEGAEAGRFEGPVRRVRIDYSYAVGRFELTNAQYRRFVEATGHATAGTGCNVVSQGKLIAMPGSSWADPSYGRSIADNEPVACIRWSDAVAYVAWLSGRTGKRYRLLTEAEWEYAARAGTQGRFTWDAADMRAACLVANVHDLAGARGPEKLPFPPVDCDDGHVGVAPVGSLAPNAFGLYDMIGNVWEWIEDCYEMPYGAAPVDGSVQLAVGCDRRGARGGSWRTDVARNRPAFRGRDPDALTSQLFGTRVARDLD